MAQTTGVCEFYDPKEDFIDAVRRVYGLRSDHVVIHFGDQSWWSFIMALLAVVLRMRFTTTAHGVRSKLKEVRGSFSRSAIWRQNFMFRFASAVFAISPMMENFIKERIPRARIEVVPNGCSLVEGMDKASIPIKYSESSTFRTVTVGGTRSEKGIRFLLEAMKRARIPDGEVVIFGKQGDDHPCLKEFGDQIAVTFQGTVDQNELFDYYHTCDVFIQASSYEPFGMAPLEALLCGLPVIITRECGLSHYIQELRADFPWAISIVEYGDTNALTNAIEAHWKRKRHSQSAEEQTFPVQSLQHLSWASIARQYVHIWNHI